MSADPRCNAVIRRCAEAGSHQPPCKCILPPGREEPCQSEEALRFNPTPPVAIPRTTVGEKALFERAAEPVIVAASYQDARNWVAQTGYYGPFSGFRVITHPDHIRGLRLKGVPVFITGMASQGRNFFEMKFQLDRMKGY